MSRVVFKVRDVYINCALNSQNEDTSKIYFAPLKSFIKLWLGICLQIAAVAPFWRMEFTMQCLWLKCSFLVFFFFLKSKFATVYNSRGRVSLMLVNAHFTALENSAAGCVDDPEKQAVVDLY